MDSSSILNHFKWNEHKKHIIEEQQYLFDNNLESDCVLISAKGDRIQAHQVVLSSSSEFFRKILSELPPLIEPPTIHVPDVETCVLEAILKFIYTGETSISSSYLTTLLEFCNFLDIKGCVANGFTLNGKGIKIGNDVKQKDVQKFKCNSSSASWSSEEYLMIDQTENMNSEEDSIEPDYLEEYLEDEGGLIDIKEENVLVENGDVRLEMENRQVCFNEFISFEIEKTVGGDLDESSKHFKDTHENKKRQRNVNRQSIRCTSSQIDKALNEVNNGKILHSSYHTSKY